MRQAPKKRIKASVATNHLRMGISLVDVRA
jgi:hypothetical protein